MWDAKSATEVKFKIKSEYQRSSDVDLLGDSVDHSFSDLLLVGLQYDIEKVSVTICE